MTLRGRIRPLPCPRWTAWHLYIRIGIQRPARGGWTIVHIGMLLPESHQVFVCAQSCLRGVVLSAAELGDSSRFSTISVDEDSVLEGNCEEIIIEGVTHILEGLPALPKALLLFTSCIHHFLGTDMKIVFGELNTRFPQVGFVQCWMNPIMRKTKMPPDPFMRKQLYSLLNLPICAGGRLILSAITWLCGKARNFILYWKKWIFYQGYMYLP